MPTCPNGHESQWTDYCGVCGARMAESTPGSAGTPGAPSTATELPMATGPESCPDCGEAREDRFCEQCGHDFVAHQPGPAKWVAVVAVDRTYFDTRGGAAEPGTFPAACPERRITLSGRRVLIGRRSLSRGITPEIDLSRGPEDLGVSRVHAQLLAQPDGSWSLVDKGSTNGTYVNDSAEPIPANLLVPLADGDVIYLGTWTRITFHKEPWEPATGGSP